MSSYSQPPDSPLDPNVPDLSPEVPELEHVFTQTVHAALAQVNKAIPARVVGKIDEQTVSVQPLPRILYATQTSLIDRPVIDNVPVAQPRGANWGIVCPIAVGDVGLLICADRSIDNCVISDGSDTYDPGDTRMHSIADAIFYPGIPTTNQQTSGNGTDFVIYNGKTSLRLTQDGTLKLANQNQEMLDLLNQLMTQVTNLVQNLQSATVLVASFGAAPFTAATVAQLTTIQTNVQQIQTNFDTLLDSGD